MNITRTDNVAWFCENPGAVLPFPFSMTVLGGLEEFPIITDQPRGPLNWHG